MLRPFLALVLVALVGPLLAACSTNPATGQQSFTAFMDSEEEARVGSSEHPKILERYGGAYDDPYVEKYIRALGNKLAQYSELPNLAFTFTVLDDEIVNAFALPGGYVYVTRGLLGILNTEAELAGVMGHEIGHVTARHGARR
ncbi:MAG: M48 family metalloprotease, partial [Rhodospirillales bacterium]